MKECPNCKGIGTIEAPNGYVMVCCVCLGKGGCPETCSKCSYHLYDFGTGESGCAIKDNQLHQLSAKAEGRKK